MTIIPSPILRFFDYGRLPESPRVVSEQFYELAWEIERTLPTGPEKSAGLRKLLEAKDCLVRAALPLPHGDSGGDK